jgi:hypothetical protein
MSRQRRHLLKQEYRDSSSNLLSAKKIFNATREALSCLVKLTKSTSQGSEALNQNVMPSQTETGSRVTGPACLSNWVGDQHQRIIRLQGQGSQSAEQQSYKTILLDYRTRKFELEYSISAQVRSSIHWNGTYPTLKTFLRFF